MKVRWLLPILLNFTACAPDYEDSLHFVARVAAGNELVLNDGVRVRLLGLADTPANAEALQNQAVGQRVRLAFDSNYYPAETESGSPIAAYVLTENGTCLNRLLLQNNPAALAAEAAPYDSLNAFRAATGQQVATQTTSPTPADDDTEVTAHAVPENAPADLSDLADELEPAVLLIETNGGKLGTGFFVGPGLAVSNHHVFEAADQWRVTLADGRVRPVTEIVEDRPERDYVIFRVGGDLGQQVYLRPAPRTPRRASPVYVIGNPNGLARTFTTGVVSALRPGTGPDDFIQFDAAISPGSSGSPVLNAAGEVVGIATFKRTECENCNFAVNIRLLSLGRFD